MRSASLRSQRTIHKPFGVLSVSPFDDKETASECSKMGYQEGTQFAVTRTGLQSQFFEHRFRLISTLTGTKPLVNKGSFRKWEIFAIREKAACHTGVSCEAS